MSNYMHGPEFLNDGQVNFRLWAPSAEKVELVLNGKAHVMSSSNGWYSLTTQAKHGDRYHFLINGTIKAPDPASRFQPNGVDGDSMLVDHSSYLWQESNWQGRPWEEAVIYELHTGCFSPSGNYKGIEEKLDYLTSTGITAIELLPIVAFKGEHGWGYDGVLPYAPHAVYGAPEELKELIAAAHKRGLMVFLDVVYNHFGPAGNYLHEYAKPFFTEKYQTPWGAAINFENVTEVRRFFIDNALYWLNEYRFDGLRFDAVHAIADASEKHFLYQLAEEIRTHIPQNRHVHLILENDHNEVRYLSKTHFNAQWNDDIHHVFHVLATSENKGYYADYQTNPVSRLARCLTEGFAYQGEVPEARGGNPRGEKSAHLPPSAFIAFTQNHDQIGNRAFGERLAALAPEEKLTLVMAILLLSPQPPMLFMGEEWWATTPFFYFCDFEGELADAVREGRRKEFAGFPEFSDPKKRARIPDPNAKSTFESSCLNWAEIETEPYHKHLAFTQKLLALRQEHIVPLLKTGWVKNTSRLIGAQGLEVCWQYQGGELKLIANFSGEELAGVPASHKTHVWGSFGDILPPWKCAFSVSVAHD